MDLNVTNSTLNNCLTISPDPQQTRFVESITNVAKYSSSLVAFLLVMNTATEILTLLGNLTVIVTVVAYRQLWVPTNILVASLAVADFTIGLILQTSNVMSIFSAFTNSKRGVRCTGYRDSYCAIMLDSIGVVTITVTLAHLSLITLDRFAAIVYPLRYVTIITMSRIKKAVMCAWTTSFVFGCLATIPSPLTNGMRALWNLFMLLSCLFMITLYGKLYCISRKHTKQIRDEIQSINPGAKTKEERRGLMTIAIVTVAMVTSYSTVVALDIDNKIASGERGETTKLVHDILTQFAIILILFNSALNPLVYFFRSQKLRTYSLNLIKSISTRIQECF